MQGWSVYIHTGASAQKYNADSFQPQRWLEQSTGAHSSSSKSSAPAAQELPASSDDHREVTEGSHVGQRDAAASEPAGAGPAKTGCPEHSLPFGLGPRMCLGRHLVKTALVMLVAELASQYQWQMGDPAEQWSIFPTVRPKGGLPVCGYTKM